MAALHSARNERSSTSDPELSDSEARDRAMRAFHHRGAFAFSSHSGRCCQIAREWFAGLTRAHQALDGDSLSWTREYWAWGAHSWPLHWCELAATRNIDCGALAAVASEALRVAGTESVNIQTIERFDDSATETWREAWKGYGGGDWVSGCFACHEVVGVMIDKSPHLRIWDPTDGCWIEDRPTRGYASAVALRITSDPATSASRALFEWRGAIIAPNEWHLL